MEFCIRIFAKICQQTRIQDRNGVRRDVYKEFGLEKD